MHTSAPPIASLTCHPLTSQCAPVRLMLLEAFRQGDLVVLQNFIHNKQYNGRKAKVYDLDLHPERYNVRMVDDTNEYLEWLNPFNLRLA